MKNKHFSIAAMMMLVTGVVCCQQASNKSSSSNVPTGNSKIGGPCEDCDIMFDGMPQNIPPVDTTAGWYEAGQKILVHGTVYKLDGKTPAPNVILYYHQTDNTGYYTPGKEQQGRGRRHGHLRGWIKTDKNGNYALYTVKPAPYPDATIPAHIHFYVKEPQIANEYWVDDITFDDDPLLTAKERARQPNRGGNGVVQLEMKNGLWQARRNFVLGLNIPDYPKD